MTWPDAYCKVNRIDGYRYLQTRFMALPRAKTVDD